MCSRLANYRADRFAAFAFLALGYLPPVPDFNVNVINAKSLSARGYENFGYWNFFAKDEAAKVIENHVSYAGTSVRCGLKKNLCDLRLCKIESFFSLTFAEDPTMVNKHFCPTGALEAWLLTDQKTKRATYISEEVRT